MSKATPGPWTIERRPEADRPAQFGVIHGPSGSSDWVADVGYCDEKDGSSSIANARLIAAAPEGHEVLMAIHEFFRHWNPADPSALLRDDGTTLKQAVEAYVAKVQGATR